MTQWLTVLAAVGEDWSCIPVLMSGVSQPPIILVPGDPLPSSDLHRHLHTWQTLKHTYTHTHTQS